MTPTNKLRFVERQHGYRTTNGQDVMPNMVRILQQWWSIGMPAIAEDPSRAGDGEWRDVPLEAEE